MINLVILTNSIVGRFGYFPKIWYLFHIEENNDSDTLTESWIPLFVKIYGKQMKIMGSCLCRTPALLVVGLALCSISLEKKQKPYPAAADHLLKQGG